MNYLPQQTALLVLDPSDGDFAESAMQADAWATALTVMGIDAGLAFARDRGLAARFVPRRGVDAQVQATPAFDTLVVAR